jgi:hypothetical protein
MIGGKTIFLLLTQISGGEITQVKNDSAELLFCFP